MDDFSVLKCEILESEFSGDFIRAEFEDTTITNSSFNIESRRTQFRRCKLSSNSLTVSGAVNFIGGKLFGGSLKIRHFSEARFRSVRFDGVEVRNFAIRSGSMARFEKCSFSNCFVQGLVLNELEIDAFFEINRGVGNVGVIFLRFDPTMEKNKVPPEIKMRKGFLVIPYENTEALRNITNSFPRAMLKGKLQTGVELYFKELWDVSPKG